MIKIINTLKINIAIGKIPLPYFYSSEMVWKDYQFQAPDFLFNALNSGDENMKKL